jgi:hypothetical protein
VPSDSDGLTGATTFFILTRASGEGKGKGRATLLSGFFPKTVAFAL